MSNIHEYHPQSNNFSISDFGYKIRNWSLAANSNKQHRGQSTLEQQREVKKSSV